MSKLINISITVLLITGTIMSVTGCSDTKTQYETEYPETSQIAQETNRNTQTTSDTPVQPVHIEIETVTEPVKGESYHPIAQELFSWYKSEYLDLQFITTPDWRMYNADDAFDMYGGFYGDILKPYSKYIDGTGSEIITDILIYSVPEEACIAILFEKIEGDHYPDINEYFDSLTWEISEMGYWVEAEARALPETETIGGNVYQQLEADYIKSGNRYRQRYYVNMKDGYVRTILITQLVKESMSDGLIEMFHAYGEQLTEPEVILPKEIVGTWEAQGTDITRVIREDGTGNTLGYDDEDGAFTWGVIGEYGFFFNFNGVLHRSYYHLDGDTLTVTNSHNEDWTLIYTRID